MFDSWGGIFSHHESYQGIKMLLLIINLERVFFHNLFDGFLSLYVRKFSNFGYGIPSL